MQEEVGGEPPESLHLAHLALRKLEALLSPAELSEMPRLRQAGADAACGFAPCDRRRPPVVQQALAQQRSGGGLHAGGERPPGLLVRDPSLLPRNLLGWPIEFDGGEPRILQAAARNADRRIAACVAVDHQVQCYAAL